MAAWAAAVFAHLGLLQSVQPAWIPPSVMLALGALGLLFWGGRLWWMLSALALAIPLFFLRDWLTQSLVMLLIAAAGALSVTSRPGGGWGVGRVAHWITAAVYFIAAFHKINQGWFDAQVSCAVYGWAELTALFPFLGLSGEPPFAAALPPLVVGVEVLIGGLLLRRPRFALWVGLGFHLPLTLALAPAYVFVLLPGYAAALSDADRVLLGRLARRHRARLAAFAVPLGAAVWWLMEPRPPLDMGLKIVALFGLLALSTIALAAGVGPAPSYPEPPRRRARLLATGLVALFVANALTPYLGTQFQHTGAMLSNLRIDGDCWNHWLVPVEVRRVDAYFRFDQAQLGSEAAGTVGRFPDVEATLTTQLWASAALLQMRRNWCTERTRPIRLSGTYRGEAIHFSDLCDRAQEIPPGPGVWGGSARFADYLRFQKNLSRSCPSECVH